MQYSFDHSPAPGAKISINTEEEIDYWCRFFGCKKSDLLDTVFKVGLSAVSVEAYLAMNGLSQKGTGYNREQS